MKRAAYPLLVVAVVLALVAPACQKKTETAAYPAAGTESPAAAPPAARRKDHRRESGQLRRQPGRNGRLVRQERYGLRFDVDGERAGRNRDHSPVVRPGRSAGHRGQGRDGSSGRGLHELPRREHEGLVGRHLSRGDPAERRAGGIDDVHHLVAGSGLHLPHTGSGLHLPLRFREDGKGTFSCRTPSESVKT